MDNQILGELDRRLSMVKRWVVVPTLQKQSVAEHSFNVERIAVRIAERWFGIRAPTELFRISQLALHHDDDEAITGDIPSPSKWILDENWIDSRSRQWYNNPAPYEDILKLADKMEAYQFLTMEYKLGNVYINTYRTELRNKMYRAIEAYGFALSDHLEEWINAIDRMEGTTIGSAP